jgi:hypothetical protein
MNDYPAWSLSHTERDARDFRALPENPDDIDMDVWRICGLERTVEEEMADEEEAAMQRGWRE